ncbi:MAG: putative ABC transporter permease subunit [Gemmatimonas sp.]
MREAVIDSPVSHSDSTSRKSASALHLLAPKWLMAMHRARQNKKGDFRRTFVVTLLALGFWAATFSIAFKLLKYFKSAEDIGTVLAGKVLAMILMAFGSILLLSNVVSSLSNFFLARDLDQISAAPVKPWSLYLARLSETALHSSWMVSLLLLPIMTAYGVAFDGGIAFVPVAVATMGAYLLIPSALGASITLLLVNVFPARRTRDLLSVITALSIAGLVMLFRAARPERLVKPEGFKNFTDFIVALDTPSSPWLPSEWVSEALMGFLDGGRVWQPLAQLWAVAIVLVIAGGLMHRRYWQRGFSQAQEGQHRPPSVNKRRPLLDRALSWMSPVRRELVLKEMRVFARDSTQWSQLIVLGVLLVVYVANVRYLPLNGEGVTTLLRNLIPFLNLALAGFVLASVAARFVFPSVSLEGRSLWLLRSSPLAMHDLLWAKFWTGALPLLIVAMALVGATNAMLHVQSFVNIVSLTAVAGLVFPLTALALAFGTFYPRFDSENAAQIPTSFRGLLFMMTAIVLIGVVAYATGRPAARWVVAEHFGYERDPVQMVLPFVIAALVCVSATVGPMALARRRMSVLD